ncbi:hypothetical protein KKF55_06050 [Patescibacteria group bacterium]|nr:hypothetical protein [Patescibacteria group bacterium]
MTKFGIEVNEPVVDGDGEYMPPINVQASQATGLDVSVKSYEGNRRLLTFDGRDGGDEQDRIRTALQELGCEILEVE